jgi:DNA-binding MarR family transcriptional regulator
VADLPQRLVAAFSAFGPAFLKWMSAGARDSGVTYARMRALHVLRCNGPTIMSGLRDELGVTARSVTALVDALEEEALVKRVPHPTDRRATIVVITEHGRERVHGRVEAHNDRAAELFARLPVEDQQALARIIERLGNELADLKEL